MRISLKFWDEKTERMTTASVDVPRRIKGLEKIVDYACEQFGRKWGLSIGAKDITDAARNWADSHYYQILETIKKKVGLDYNPEDVFNEETSDIDEGEWTNEDYEQMLLDEFIEEEEEEEIEEESDIEFMLNGSGLEDDYFYVVYHSGKKDETITD